jgi:hypothetical protein
MPRLRQELVLGGGLGTVEGLLEPDHEHHRPAGAHCRGSKPECRFTDFALMDKIPFSCRYH